MGRPKIVEDADVLQGAMHAFWRQGFRAVSIKDLERATGVRSGSLYHSYGDKDGIFRAAFAHYNETIVRARISRYLDDGTGLEGVRAFFLSLLQPGHINRHGCLTVNSAIEFGSEESIASDAVKEGFSSLENGFARAVKEAALNGDLNANLVQCTAVLKLLVLYQGIIVLIRMGHRAEALIRLVDTEINQMHTPSIGAEHT